MALVPAMTRAGAALLAASVVSVWLIAVAGALLVFLSWLLCGVGLAVLARDTSTRRPARAGLVAVALAAAFALAGAGVTLGRGGRTLLATPGFDPSVVLVTFGITAAFWGAGIFVLLYERARGQKLATVGAWLLGVSLAWFVLDALARAGVVERGIAVGGQGLYPVMMVGAVLMLAAFARAVAALAGWRRPPDPEVTALDAAG